jgi:hypothetical protein
LPEVRVANDFPRRFNFDEYLFMTAREVPLPRRIVNFSPLWNSTLREYFLLGRDTCAQGTPGTFGGVAR